MVLCVFNLAFYTRQWLCPLSVHSTFCLNLLQWFSIPFGVLASICIWRCQRYNWPLSEIFPNTGSFFGGIPAVAGVSSVSTYYSLIQRWNPVLPLSPERHPYSSFNFQGSTIKSFCRYTFLYLFRFNAIISPVTANVNSTSCVLGSFLYSFLLIFCYLVL